MLLLLLLTLLMPHGGQVAFMRKVSIPHACWWYSRALSLLCRCCHPCAQAAFMSYVFGGAGEYTGRDLGAAHRKLIRDKGMNEHHFNLVAGAWGGGEVDGA